MSTADPRLTALVRAHLACMDEVKRLEAELAAAKMRQDDSAQALWDVVLGELDRNYLLTDGERHIIVRCQYQGRPGLMAGIHVGEVTPVTQLDEPLVRVEGLAP